MCEVRWSLSNCLSITKEGIDYKNEAASVESSGDVQFLLDFNADTFQKTRLCISDTIESRGSFYKRCV